MAGPLLTVIAFLAGSFPSGLVLTRLVTGKDVRTVGSGNIGAANSSRAGGLKVGVGVAVLDILKGLIPVLIGRQIGLSAGWLAIVALAAVLGHDFSIFLRFRGGKGVATTLGVMLVLAPVATVAAMVVWLIVLGTTRITSLASLLALAVLPVAVAATHGPPQYVWLAAGLFLLAVVKHWPNLMRLSRGEEPRIGRTRPAHGE